MRLARVIGSSIMALGLSSAFAQTVNEFHIFLPSNAIWINSTPMINEDGISKPLTPDPQHCGWFTRRYVDEKIPSKVFIHPDHDEILRYAIGAEGDETNFTGDSPTAIDLNGFFELFKTEATFSNALYFVADENQANTHPSTTKGWFTERPCFGICQDTP